MHVKFILPSLQEAEAKGVRPIKYSLFPPLGLASLASHLKESDRAELVDQHVQALSIEDVPDLVVIQVYITNAYRAYAIADHYRQRGVHVAMGGLHVTSLPMEASAHADTLFIGPGDHTFPQFLKDFRRGCAKSLYASKIRTLVGVPPIRRDLIQRSRYLVPNSLVVTRGCPFHCSFCYKDAFFKGGRSFYTAEIDSALAEIDRLPGRHLYFLDDHLLGHRKFARELFAGMAGMGRLFQGAATVDSILRGDLIERAVAAGLRSIFIGFESLDDTNHAQTGKVQNLGRRYKDVIERLDSLGVMINGSFVFGLDGDGPDVFRRTVDWAVESGITTATFHVATPYPGTEFHRQMAAAGRIITDDWDRYDTRQVVFQPKGMSAETLEKGYQSAYRDFYSWPSIIRASQQHQSYRQGLRHLAYAGGWRKAEPLWRLLIQARSLGLARPFLETLLTREKHLVGKRVTQLGATTLSASANPVHQQEEA